MAVWRCRRRLAFGQAVGLVVHYNDSNIDVAQGRVYKMAYANTEEITITTDCHNSQVRASHLQTLGNSQRAPVDTMETKSLHKVWETARAADTRYHHCLLG